MIKPMLAQLEPKPFNDPRYLWETKYDGIRAIITGGVTGKYTIQARSGSDKTQLFPEINLRTKKPTILDGELISLDGTFNGIQHRANRINGIAQAVRDYPAQYAVFDVLEVDGTNLMYTPLIKRKEILQELVIPSDNVLVAQFVEDGEALFAKMIETGGEGVIGKLKTGTYQEGKRGWFKVKATQMGEFVICGYTPGTGWRASTFGALVLGKQDGNKLTYVGSVGTGFNDQEIANLYKHLLELRNDICPFLVPPPETAVWVMPEMVIKVRFLEYTADKRLRFPAYKGRI